MAILYSENFDGMAEGLSPPTGWIKDTTYVLTDCEVDDVQAHSGAHSMWVLKSTAGVAYCRHPITYTSEPLEYWCYFPGSQRHYMNIQSDNSNYDISKIGVMLYFSKATATTTYNTPGGWVDTGIPLGTGWHKVKIVCDYTAETFDLWYDDVKIIIGGLFYSSQSTAGSIQFGALASQWWIDNIQVGESIGAGVVIQDCNMVDCIIGG